jgi:tetratricopeptide (TPR) repeat protein
VRSAGALLAAGLLCALAAAPAQAQDITNLNALVESGLRHYQRLEYDSAVISLRRALRRTPADSLTDSARARALTYLAASELFRGRRDSALAVFRRLVILDPRTRPDPLVFPPEVQTIYDFARDVTKVVAVQAPRDTSIRLGADRFLARLYASSFHQIIVTLEREDGFTVRTLYAGPISDTLQVYWTGEDTVFMANDSGRLVFTVTSLSSAGRQARVLRLPLDLVLGPQDTLPTPPPLPDSLFLPEREPAKVGFRALGRGAGIGVAVALLPGLVAGGDAPSGSRFFVAGGLTIAGVVGFLKHRPGRPLLDNISANQSLRDGWQAQIQMTAQENAIRVLQKRLDIHVGRPEVIGGTS